MSDYRFTVWSRTCQYGAYDRSSVVCRNVKRQHFILLMRLRNGDKHLQPVSTAVLMKISANLLTTDDLKTRLTVALCESAKQRSLLLLFPPCFPSSSSSLPLTWTVVAVRCIRWQSRCVCAGVSRRRLTFQPAVEPLKSACLEEMCSVSKLGDERFLLSH